MKPRSTLMCSVRSYGLVFAFRSNRASSFAPFEAMMETKFAAVGSLNCGLPMSDAKR